MSTANALTLRYSANLYATETKYEVVKQLRNRIYCFSAIGFPVVFYLLFGVITNREVIVHGVSLAKYLMASYCCFGMLGAALFGVGVNFAIERGNGWLEVKQASPMPPPALLLAKTISSACFALTVSILLIVIGRFAANVHLTALETIKLLGVIVAGAIPFGAMGLLFGLLAPPNAAPGLMNLVYLPMSFFSGLWIPLSIMPHWVGRIGVCLPSYHLAQLAYRAVGFSMDSIPSSTHWLALAGFTLIFLGIGWIAFRRANMKA
jgi:ABC-2 type transport system permease protein